jgi:hypothetical protein
MDHYTSYISDLSNGGGDAPSGIKDDILSN